MAVDRGRAARSLAWTLLESGGVSGLSLVALLAFAWLLTPAELGIAAIALGVVQILAIPVETLFHDALVQRREVEAAHRDSAFVATLALAAALAAASWALAAPLARAIGIPEVGPVLAWMGLSVLGSGLMAVPVALHRRAMEFRPLAVRSFLGRLLGAAGGIAVALSGGGAWAIVVQQVLVAWAAAAILLALSPPALRPRLAFSAAHFGQIIRFGMKSVAVTAANFLDRRLFLLLVGAQLGPAPAGVLSLAFRLVDMLYDLVAGAAQQLALPLFRLRRDDGAALRRTMGEAVGLTCLLGLPVFAGLGVAAPEVVEVLFGARWEAAAPLMAALAFLALTMFPRLYAWPLMAALDAPLLPLAPVLAALAVILLGMPLVGYLSLAAAMGVWAVRRAVALAVDVWALRRVSGLGARAQLAPAANPLLAALAMALVVALARAWLLAGLAAPLRLAAMAGIGALVYPALMLLLDRALLWRLLVFVRAGLHGASGTAADHAKGPAM